MRLFLTLSSLALFTAEFLWPAEDAVNGSGLHLVFLWFLLGVVHSLHLCFLRTNETQASSSQEPFGWLDVGVLLIAVGHIVSTAFVFQIEGDRRAALNLTMEWAALFVAFRIFRSLVSDRRLAMQTISVTLFIVVGLSAYGVWQHHVFYPEQSAWYRNQRHQLDAALEKPGGAGYLQASDILSDFQAQGIPLEGSARILWENRLLSSSEPFGTFSLANTLAGILATGLVLIIGHAFSRWGSGPRRSFVGFIITGLQIGLVGYCLVLTKSRSAWLGAVTGLLVAGLLHSGFGSARKAISWVAGGGFILGLVVCMAAFSGALDKEVILESPRSLQFRLLYWTGTLKMLQESPVQGAGPGNFRQAYLEHKAAESSEEIRDPHNFVLEAWSSAGLTGLVGVLIVSCCVVRYLTVSANNMSAVTNRTAGTDVIGAKIGNAANSVRGVTAASEAIRSAASVPARRTSRSWAAAAVLLGWGLQTGWQWIDGRSVEVDAWFAGLAFLFVVMAMFERRWCVDSVDRISCVAAALTMMVNLLAAGGFSMPPVMLLLLVCLAIGGSVASVRESARRGISVSQRVMHGVFAILCLCATLLVSQFGLGPVISVERQVRHADDLMQRQRNPRAALEVYRKAAEEDRFAVVPLQRIAELETAKLREMELASHEPTSDSEVGSEISSELDAQELPDSQKSVSIAVAACDALILADRRSSFAVRLKADCLELAAKLIGSGELWQDAVAQRQRVVTMYPSSVDDWVRLVRTCEAVPSGDWKSTYQQAAIKALQLEEINRQWGHQDLYLSDATVTELKQIVDESQR